MSRLLLLLMLLWSSPAFSATYFISPTGNDANNGTSAATPWKTFTWAINPARATCGNSLVLADGQYGDGFGTGKISVASLLCSAGNELIITSTNQRQAKIVDNGCGKGISITDSSGIIIDGLYIHSTDNSGCATSESGTIISTKRSSSIIIRNNVGVNPNRYANSHVYDTQFSTNVLLEGNECITFHRHCHVGWGSQQVVVRLAYATPRGGRISGGFGAANGLGRADALFSMYPCQDCILENSIADGTTGGMYLNEMNATYGVNILMSGAKVLGSICYKCDYGNGVYLSSRNVADLNHTPQNILIENYANIGTNNNANGIRVSDGVNITVNHYTYLGGPGTSSARGLSTDDLASTGTGSAQNSITVTNALVAGLSTSGAIGFNFSGFATFSLDHAYSVGNASASNPSIPNPNITNFSTSSHGMGACLVFVPSGAAVSGAGTGGSDIGANVLYRYVNGVLTTTPLWNPVTGAFPAGAADLDGVNRVAGQSLFDIHNRLNVNTNGCSLPSGYGGGGGTGGTVTIGTTANSGDCTTTCNWTQTFSVGQDLALVNLALRDDGSNVGSVSSVTIGGTPASFVGRAITVPAWRSCEQWKLPNPPAGLQTIAVTTTGAVSGMVGRSMEFDTTSGLNTAVAAVSPPNTPTSAVSVTAPTNTNELVVDCVASSPSVSYAVGANQTGYGTVSHGTKSILLGSSTQPGTFGGVMDNTLGGNVYWAQSAVSLVATPSDPPTTAVLHVTKFLIRELFGTETGAGSLANLNGQGSVGTTGAYRVRVELTASIATTTPFGVQLFCQRNADGFTRAFDAFNGKIFRLHGLTADPDVPPSLTDTTPHPLMTGATNFIPGKVLTSDQSVFIVPALAPGQHTELEWPVDVQGAIGNTVQCYPYMDDGTPIDLSPLVTPTVGIIDNLSSVGN